MADTGHNGRDKQHPYRTITSSQLWPWCQRKEVAVPSYQWVTSHLVTHNQRHMGRGITARQTSTSRMLLRSSYAANLPRPHYYIICKVLRETLQLTANSAPDMLWTFFLRPMITYRYRRLHLKSGRLNSAYVTKSKFAVCWDVTCFGAVHTFRRNLQQV